MARSGGVRALVRTGVSVPRVPAAACRRRRAHQRLPRAGRGRAGGHGPHPRRAWAEASERPVRGLRRRECAHRIAAR